MSGQSTFKLYAGLTFQILHLARWIIYISEESEEIHFSHGQIYMPWQWNILNPIKMAYTYKIILVDIGSVTFDEGRWFLYPLLLSQLCLKGEFGLCHYYYLPFLVWEYLWLFSAMEILGWKAIAFVQVDWMFSSPTQSKWGCSHVISNVMRWNGLYVIWIK